MGLSSESPFLSWTQRVLAGGLKVRMQILPRNADLAADPVARIGWGFWVGVGVFIGCIVGGLVCRVKPRRRLAWVECWRRR